MAALRPREAWNHGSTEEVPDELRERAVRLVLDVKDDAGSVSAVCTRVGEQLGSNGYTLPGPARQAEIDAGRCP